jgi:hypothetical protein
VNYSIPNLSIMKTRKLLIGLFVITSICCSFISCKNDSYSSFSYLVYVDSVKVPETITANTPFEVNVFGTVGGTSCSFFEQYVQTPNGNDIYIEVMARYEDKDRTCQEKVSYIEDSLKLTLTSAGTYKLKFVQPSTAIFEIPITVN